MPATSSLLFIALTAALPEARAGGLDPALLASRCEAGDTASCLTLARARTGAGLPVDLVSARQAYERACAQADASGCAGATGIGRLLGRHVDLHLLHSEPRVWVLAGPTRVTAGGRTSPVDDALAAAVDARLGFAAACYAAGVEEDAGLEGLLDLSLLLGDGRVEELVLHQASIADQDTAACIVQELGRLSVPPGEPDGELFMRLCAEPAPAAARRPPVIQDHLADGAQVSIGGPVVSLPAEHADRRRLEIAVTAAARRALADAPCVLDDVETGHWDPVDLRLVLRVEPEGTASSVVVTGGDEERAELQRCLASRLQRLPVGQTGLDAPLHAELQMHIAPVWTDTWVP